MVAIDINGPPMVQSSTKRPTNQPKKKERKEINGIQNEE